MAEETPTPQPSTPSQNPPSSQQPRRDGSRHQGGRRHHGYRNPAPRPAEAPAEKPRQETKELSLDDEETEQDRSAAPTRPRGGGRGKPPKRVIEEWANDIYCE